MFIPSIFLELRHYIQYRDAIIANNTLRIYLKSRDWRKTAIYQVEAHKFESVGTDPQIRISELFDLGKVKNLKKL